MGGNAYPALEEGARNLLEKNKKGRRNEEVPTDDKQKIHSQLVYHSGKG